MQGYELQTTLSICEMKQCKVMTSQVMCQGRQALTCGHLAPKFQKSDRSEKRKSSLERLHLGAAVKGSAMVRSSLAR